MHEKSVMGDKRGQGDVQAGTGMQQMVAPIDTCDPGSRPGPTLGIRVNSKQLSLLAAPKAAKCGADKIPEGPFASTSRTRTMSSVRPQAAHQHRRSRQGCRFQSHLVAAGELKNARTVSSLWGPGSCQLIYIDDANIRFVLSCAVLVERFFRVAARLRLGLMPHCCRSALTFVKVAWAWLFWEDGPGGTGGCMGAHGGATCEVLQLACTADAAGRASCAGLGFHIWLSACTRHSMDSVLPSCILPTVDQLQCVQNCTHKL